jgi:DnaJ-domain-containing protein 1
MAEELWEDEINSLPRHAEDKQPELIPEHMSSSVPESQDGAAAEEAGRSSADESGSSGAETSLQGSSSALLFGVFLVVGAVASNVIGFRHSRWAVNKDLYRAWERRNAYKSSSSTRPSPFSTSDRGWQSSQASGASRMFEEFRRQAQQAEQAKQAERQRRANEEASRQSHKGATQESSRATYESWESTARGGHGSGDGTRFEFFHDATLEDLLRNMRARGVHEFSTSFSKQGDMNPRLLREILRTMLAEEAQAANASGHRRSSAFDSFDWDDLFGPDVSRKSGSRQSSSWGQSQQQHAGSPGAYSTSTSRSSALATLGLGPSASPAHIKAAYRSAMMRYHPDKAGGSERAANKYRDAVAAYQVLSSKA